MLKSLLPISLLIVLPLGDVKPVDPFSKMRETRTARYLRAASGEREERLRHLGSRIKRAEKQLDRLEARARGEGTSGRRGRRPGQEEKRHERQRLDPKERRKRQVAVREQQEKLERMKASRRRLLDMTLYEAALTPSIHLARPLKIGQIGAFDYGGGCRLEVQRVLNETEAIVWLWCSDNANSMHLWLKNVSTKNWVDDRQIERIPDIFDVVGKAKPPATWPISDLVFVLECCPRPTPPAAEKE